MNEKKIKAILELHNQWISNSEKGEHANLRDADLRDADLDFSVFPLWCGSFKMVVDDRLVRQLVYHLLKLNYQGNSKDIKKMFNLKTLKSVANKSHLIEKHSQDLIK